MLVSFNPGPRWAANIASFQRTITKFCLRGQKATCVVTDQRPNGVTNYASIDATPTVLAALLAVNRGIGDGRRAGAAEVAAAVPR